MTRAPEQRSDMAEYGYRRTSLFTVIDWMGNGTKKRAHTHTQALKTKKQKKVAILWTQDGMGREMAYTLPQVRTWFISSFVSEFR